MPRPTGPRHPRARPTATTSPDGLPPLRDVIARHELRAKKSLGQNFLLDLNLTGKIARCCGPLDGRTVVEIGPGPGGLTRALLAEGANQIIAVERDDRCLPALAEIQAYYPGRLQIEAADALTTDWAALLTKHGGAGMHKPIIAANLPYGIATKLLTNWLETMPWPPWYDRMVLMFQKEVAERIVAQRRTKAYGRLAVLAQWRCTAHIAFTLPPTAFVPAPKISSAIVVLDPRAQPQPACSVEHLSRLTAAAFGQRRKMLRSSLRQLTDRPEYLLDAVGIPHDTRGEDLDVSQFEAMAAAMRN